MRIGALTVLTAAIAASLALGWSLGRSTSPAVQSGATGAEQSTPAAPQILYYRNPMGLPDTSPVPKKDSMGMDYLPVYAGQEPARAGTVVLSPEQVQKIGVRTTTAQRRVLTQGIRASATIAVDQSRQYVIAPKFEGWVQTLHANQVGMQVRRGQALMTVYSPELLSAQEEYRIASTASMALRQGDSHSAEAMRRLGDAALARLRNWDIGAAQLAALKGGQPQRFLTLTSPADAVVVEKPVLQGARFMPGETVLALADLSRVWVLANVPAMEAHWVRVGLDARFTSPALPGRVFDGKVSFIAPMIDPAARTLSVRLELDNPEGVLRPALFGDVAFAHDAEDSKLTVPRAAVLDSGQRQLVFVQLAEGRFEPRKVQIGTRSGDWLEITDGLVEGEVVVTAANFLIDAESNLSSALAGMSPHADHGGAQPSSAAPATEPPEPATAAKPTASDHEHDQPGAE